MSATAVFADDTPLIFGNKNTYGIGPRAMGMGGAFAAVADDASAVWWNPAGLVQMPAYTLSLSSAPVYFQKKVPGRDNGSAFGSPYYESIQLVIPIAKENTIGISLFRPFHPQRNYFSADSTKGIEERKEDSYLLNPSFQEDDIIFTYSTRFSAAKNFSMGVNVERITSDPDFIRYFGSDVDTQTALQSKIRVRGFGVGLGFMYRIPITQYSQEVRIGLTLNDLVSRVQYLDELNVANSSGITYKYSSGYETEIPPEIVLGLAYKNNIFFKVRNITALDLSQISDNRYSGSENKSLRVGTEFWFLKDVVGLRGGYSTPMSRPGTLHLGISVRGLSGNLEADLVYLHPLHEAAELNTSTAGFQDEGINFEKFHMGLSYRFGSEPELPPPAVSAQVNPAAFVPSKGEKTEFLLDTTTDVTLDRWSVLIYNPQGKLVRGLRGNGTPPTRLVWAGESDTYEPLPSGTYTWAFQVRDNLGHVGSTAVQTVELVGIAPEVAKDPRKLYNLRQQQAALLAQESQRLAAQARDAMKKLLEKPEATPSTANASASASKVPEAAGNTLVPDAGNVAFLTARNLSADQVLNAHFEVNEKNERVVMVSYRSNLTYVPYIYQEASDVAKSTVQTVGSVVPAIHTRVYYGKNEMDIRTPSGVAANYAEGRITRDQLIGLSDVRINGEKVTPNAP
jgi:hypothetical protein